MTENKRFTTVELLEPNRWGIWYDGAYLSTYQVCILLNEYVDVKNENEQLKQTLDELANYDKEKGLEMEYINDIYKKEGFKGVIEYAKDQLSDYGTVREVDKGLWLFATGGWSDHESWLHCLLNWNFMYRKGHYRATTSGGGYYYSEEPYADIEVRKREVKG